MEGFCAPFGRKVKECVLEFVLDVLVPKFGDHMSVEFKHCSRAELSGAQLSTFFRADSWAPDSWAPGPKCPLFVADSWAPDNTTRQG